MKDLFIYLRAGLLALAMLLIGSVFLASPASAHQGNISASSACQPDGTYLVTYKLSWSQVPQEAYGTRILTREDTDDNFDSGWENNPGGYTWTDRGAISSPQGEITWTDTLPGTSARGPWEYAWLDWSNGNQSNKFHDTRIDYLGGDCEDTTPEPEDVTVNATFGDNVCVDNVYTEPTLTAPEFAGTTREITGTVEPGSTVTVTYTALPNFVINGQSVFEHTYPTTPASSKDCQKTPPPQPQTVTVNASFGDNVCVGNVYTQPTLNAPEFTGTTRQVTGAVEPGGNVTVTYTALAGYVISGQSVFQHSYPATPASVVDCERNNQPEPEVQDRSQERTSCDGVERREWELVREYVWVDDEWVLGEPEVVNDTGWVLVRELTLAEQEALGCLEVEGEQETDNEIEQGGNEEQQPTIEVAPDQGTPDVPRSVDAGLAGESWVAPAGPRWLAPLLGGVIILGLAAFTRLKQVGEQQA